MLFAITRNVSPAIGNCELTHMARETIDLHRARLQHRQYEQRLKEAGCQLIKLTADPDLPDSVFVEDTAIVLDEIGIITRPGAESRRAESDSVAQALMPYRRLVYIRAPGTLDGGDVLRVGKSLYVGRSARSNTEGINQLRELVSPNGYSVVPVVLRDCLHLKSAVTQVAEDMLLVNRHWVDARVFSSMRLIDVHESEPFAANALRIVDTVIYPEAFIRTRDRLEAQDLNVCIVDASELAKAEGGVTCCSLIFPV